MEISTPKAKKKKITLKGSESITATVINKTYKA